MESQCLFTTPLDRPLRRPSSNAPIATAHISPLGGCTIRLAIISAHGELDAANAQQFVDYALRHAPRTERLVLDLSGVEFFGTAGFSALHSVNVRCAGEKIQWAMVPSAAVTRLLRICDPDSALPISSSVDAALAAVQGEPRRLLQLVSKTG